MTATLDELATRPIPPPPQQRADTWLEDVTEAIARALAARVSRRSFLGRVGKGTIAVALGGSAGAALMNADSAFGTHANCNCQNCSCSASCNQLWGTNACPTVAFGACADACACGSWCFSDSGCPSTIRRWEDCCGINYCNCSGGPRCAGSPSRPVCVHHKTYSGGCGTIGTSQVVCRQTACTSSCNWIQNYCG
jgi:hypothetical protein